MSYSLNITDEADELIDSIIYYLIYKLNSKQAAKTLLEEIQKAYDAIAENPYLFQETEDLYLKQYGLDQGYLLIFDFRKKTGEAGKAEETAIKIDGKEKKLIEVYC